MRSDDLTSAPQHGRRPRDRAYRSGSNLRPVGPSAPRSARPRARDLRPGWLRAQSKQPASGRQAPSGPSARSRRRPLLEPASRACARL